VYVAKNRAIRTRSVGIAGRSASAMRGCARGPVYSCKHTKYKWESVGLVRCSSGRFVCACVRRLVLVWDTWTNGVVVCGTVVLGLAAVDFQKYRTLGGTKKRVRETLETCVLGERKTAVRIYVWYAVGVLVWDIWTNGVIVCGTVVVGPVAVDFRKHRTLAGTKKCVRETLETRVLGERETTAIVCVWHAAGVSTRVHFWSTWEAPVFNR
jgi:hypothetical protein